MILRTAAPTCFVLILNIFYITKYTKGEEPSDSEDDSLKQALLLVDILKSEYSNVLRQKNRDENNDDLSTCAPTDGINITSFSSSDDQYIPTTKSAEKPSISISLLLPQSTAQQVPLVSGINTSYVPSGQGRLQQLDQPLQALTTIPSPVLSSLLTQERFQTPMAQQLYGTHRSPNYPAYYMENIQRPYRAFRRRVPRDYYYFDNQMDGYDNFWHRRSLDFNRRTAEKIPTSSPSVAAIESTLTSLSPAPATSSVTNTIMTVQDATKQSLNPWIKQLKENTTKKTRRSNHILDQVAAELINEIGVTKKRAKDMLKNKEKHTLTKIRYDTKIKHRKSYGQPVTNTKTTFRVHMEGSTRLPLPLPVNNAYCFYNPRSSLCGTFI